MQAAPTAAAAAEAPPPPRRRRPPPPPVRVRGRDSSTTRTNLLPSSSTSSVSTSWLLRCATASARLFDNQNELATVFINLFSLNFVVVALCHSINGLLPSLEHKVSKGSSPLALLAQLDALDLTIVLEEFDQVIFVETGRETFDVHAPRSVVNRCRSGSGRLAGFSLFQFKLPRLLIAFGCELSAVHIFERSLNLGWR